MPDAIKKPARQEAGERGEKQKTPRTALVRSVFVMTAVCFFAAVLAGIFALRMADRSSVSVGGIARDYKDAAVMACGPAIEWPWEYKTTAEQYTTVHLNGKEYHSRGRPVDALLAGELIGTFDVAGYDAYADQTHKITGAAYRIDGISEDHMVAVKLGEEFYVFNNDEYLFLSVRRIDAHC